MACGWAASLHPLEVNTRMSVNCTDLRFILFFPFTFMQGLRKDGEFLCCAQICLAFPPAPPYEKSAVSEAEIRTIGVFGVIGGKECVHTVNVGMNVTPSAPVNSCQKISSLVCEKMN